MTRETTPRNVPRSSEHRKPRDENVTSLKTMFLESIPLAAFLLFMYLMLHFGG